MSDSALTANVELCETVLRSLNARLVHASRYEAHMLRDRRVRIQAELAALKSAQLAQQGVMAAHFVLEHLNRGL